MREITFGELAELQAARHPVPVNATGGRSRVAKSSLPLISSGRPSTRFRARGPEAIDVPVVGVKAFGRYALKRGELKTESFSVPEGSRQTFEASLLKKEDIVISMLPPYPAIYVPEDLGIFVPTAFAVVRMDDGTKDIVDPAYLAGWLSTTYVRETLLPAKASGRMLTVNALYPVPVPLPEMRVQLALGDVLIAAQRSEEHRWAMEEAEMKLLENAYFLGTKEGE